MQQSHLFPDSSALPGSVERCKEGEQDFQFAKQDISKGWSTVVSYRSTLVVYYNLYQDCRHKGLQLPSKSKPNTADKPKEK